MENNLTHTPKSVQLLTRDGEEWTAVVESHFGWLRVPLHQEQARMVWDAATLGGQVRAVERGLSGEWVVRFRPNNNLLALANPAGYGAEDELVALVAVRDGYLAWIAGAGAAFRVIGEHEGHQIVSRARRFHTRTLPQFVRQAPYLFVCKRHDGIGNDLAAGLLVDCPPVEVEAHLDALVEDDIEALFHGERALMAALHGRLAGAWRVGS